MSIFINHLFTGRREQLAVDAAGHDGNVVRSSLSD